MKNWGGVAFLRSLKYLNAHYLWNFPMDKNDVMLNIKKRSISALVNISRKYYAQKLRNTRKKKRFTRKLIRPNNTIIV